MGVDLNCIQIWLEEKDLSHHWDRLKSLVLGNANQLMKYWLNARFNGYSKEKRHCSCAEAPVLTSDHILSCPIYDVTIGLECDLMKISKPMCLELLSSHRFKDWDTWKNTNLQSLVKMERVISAAINEVLDPLYEAHKKTEHERVILTDPPEWISPPDRD